MGDPILTSPLAFELCEHGTCGEAHIRDETKGSATFKVASCKQDAEKCGGKGCYCQLFRVRKKDKEKDKDKATWDVVKLDEHHEDTDYDPETYEYKCICVTPILETKATVDDIPYTVRFVLCGSGSCHMYRPSEDDPAVDHHVVKCIGDCDGDCKCTMFRLKVKKSAAEKAAHAKWSEKDAQWEYVAPKDKNVTREDHYYYRCFCVK